jgi:hypothetical protein
VEVVAGDEGRVVSGQEERGARHIVGSYGIER